MTNRDRVLEALRLSLLPLDDDQLSERTGITPRQTINQICRRLEAVGAVRRHLGPGGKIVNELVRGDAVDMAAAAEVALAGAGGERVTGPVVQQAPGQSPAGSSKEQRDAER